MHKQLSTYLNGMWFTLLVSMTSNGLLLLLVVFWVQSFLVQMCHVPSFLLLSMTSNHGRLLLVVVFWVQGFFIQMCHVPTFLLGLNQHVALDSNAAFRRKLLQMAALMKTLTIASFSYWRHDTFSPSLSISLSLSLQTLWPCPPRTPVLCSLSVFVPSFPPSPLRPPLPPLPYVLESKDEA